MIYIGVDPGVKTGFCVYDTIEKRITQLTTLKIHKAFKEVEDIVGFRKEEGVIVMFEDARLRKWFGSNAQQKQQGAGSIKRDCTIWDDFLKDLGVLYYPVHPKNNMTKVKPDYFKSITKWEGRTSEHARDAAMLVFGK